jgi:hypothetical protein
MGQANDPDSLRRLGEFEILRELGRGGMGVMYEARQVSLNYKVAISDPNGRRGFRSKRINLSVYAPPSLALELDFLLAMRI